MRVHLYFEPSGLIDVPPNAPLNLCASALAAVSAAGTKWQGSLLAFRWLGHSSRPQRDRGSLPIAMDEAVPRSGQKQRPARGLLRGRVAPPCGPERESFPVPPPSS